MGKKRSFAEAAEPILAGISTENVATDGVEVDLDGPGEPTAKRQQQRRSLFVRSLPASATTESLIEHFSESFPVKHATAVIDKATQLCRGYGFITFADAEDAQRAKEELDGSDFQGKKIRLDIAEPRHRDKEAHSVAAESPIKQQRGPKPAQKEDQLPPKLIVRNLPWSIKNGDQLATLFRSYGKVKQAYIPSKKPGLHPGFGFVVLRGHTNAEKAMKGVNGKELDGRVLAVDWAVHKDVWQNQADETTIEPQDALEKEHDLEAEEQSGVDEESEHSSDDLDDEEADMEDVENVEEEATPEGQRSQDYSTTMFIRNLPYTCTDETLNEHFRQFGHIRYARVVMDHETERPRGTGFVCFFSADDAAQCLRGAPRSYSASQQTAALRGSSKSILQSEEADPSGAYTMEGRVLQVSKAVDRNEAARLQEQGISQRGDRDKDKRRLYLLSEGTVSAESPLGKILSPSELAMRDASLKQRKQLIQSNPSLHLSLTRLSIRNLPRSLSSKELKALAREAVVEFAKDAKEGKRQRLSKEELSRGGDAMIEAEKLRKSKGKGLVKQVKIVFEGKEGSKVEEKSGGGRSRGYGFVEYYTHRAALMGLRWLNGHSVGGGSNEDKTSKKDKKSLATQPDDAQERKKRFIVEFAIENAQVVARRRDKETKSREQPKKPAAKSGQDSQAENGAAESAEAGGEDDKEKQARRQRIINKKRAMRRSKRRSTKA